MEWYKNLTCEELLNTIIELKNELDGRTIAWAQAENYDDEGVFSIHDTFECTIYTLYPTKDDIYVE